MSGLVLGALAATVGGATYAPWSSSGSAYGSVSSGAITLSATDPVTYSGYCSNLAPGDSCTMTTVVTAGGTLSQTYSAAASASGTLASCDGGASFTLGAPTYSDSPDGGATLQQVAPGTQETVTIVATLSPGATDDCQGDSAAIVVTITGALSGSPHTDLD